MVYCKKMRDKLASFYLVLPGYNKGGLACLIGHLASHSVNTAVFLHGHFITKIHVNSMAKWNRFHCVSYEPRY